MKGLFATASLLATTVIGSFISEESWMIETLNDFESVNHVAAFQGWQKKFDKYYYTAEEESRRFLIFVDNWRKINEHNTLALNGKYSHKLGMNQFSDLTSDEFKFHVHGHHDSCLTEIKKSTNVELQKFTQHANNQNIPDSIDWTNKNGKSYVTPVKNQGHCGSCWAFSSTGALESRYAVANNGTLNSLSEQELVDCSSNEGNNACDGGLPNNAFKYVMDNNGLCLESEYPYEAKQSECRNKKCKHYNPIKNYQDVKTNNFTSLEYALLNGPVSIGIEADQQSFQFYKNGVLESDCGSSLDHGVLVVGYGQLNGQKYWKVKNSWGSTWGLNGYILLCRDCNKNNGQGQCGILGMPSYPISQ